MIVVGIIGAAIARLRPQGMARALFATACAQALVPAIALIIGKSRSMQEPPGVLGVLALNAFFVVLFVASALLFRRAGVKAQKGEIFQKTQKTMITILLNIRKGLMIKENKVELRRIELPTF